MVVGTFFTRRMQGGGVRGYSRRVVKGLPQWINRGRARTGAEVLTVFDLIRAVSVSGSETEGEFNNKICGFRLRLTVFTYCRNVSHHPPIWGPGWLERSP